jgi:hypothetical protein
MNALSILGFIVLIGIYFQVRKLIREAITSDQTAPLAGSVMSWLFKR